jgi:hypothetical protein
MSKPQMMPPLSRVYNTLMTLHFAGIGMSGDCSAKSLARGDVTFCLNGQRLLQFCDKQVSFSVLINH